MKTFWFVVLTLLLPGSHAVLRSAQNLPDLTVNPAEANPHVVYRTYAANDCTVLEGCAQPGTRRLLVFTTVTRNIGTADLIMGDPSTNSLFFFDPCHGHYHYTGFAEYRLRRTDGTLAVLGHKIGFCLEDIEQWDPNASPNRRYDCNYQGIQKGWADVYTEDTPCQWIDVTGLAAGNYTLEMETNPNRSLPESDYSNNMAAIPISLSDDCGAVPANDSFSNANVIPRSPFSFRTYNACASKEPGEPNHAGNVGGNSIWYRGTALANTVIQLSTEGSDFDTLLAVYTGSSVNNLTLVASNDDADINNKFSRLSFNAIAGTVYSIAVDGYDGAFGTAVLTINPPANDKFIYCEAVSGGSGHAAGSNIGATKEPNEPDHDGNIGGHSVWYCWTAPGTGAVEFDTVGSDFDTTMGVYVGNSVDNLALVGSNNDSGGNVTSLVGFNAVAGTLYHVAVDGVSGASGTISLNWSFRPRLTIRALSRTSMELTLSPSQGNYDVQASSDLAHWTTLATVPMAGVAKKYSDNTVASFNHRFYRAIPSTR